MKNRFLCVIVLVVLLVSAAQAYTNWWSETAVDNDWENSANWTAWPPPDWTETHAVPTAAEDVELNRQVYTEIGVGDTAVCNILMIGSDKNHTLGVVGGTLTASSIQIDKGGAEFVGIMNISGGVTSVSGDLSVGGGGLPEWAWEAGVGYLNVTGGTVQIGGSFVVGQTLTYDPGGGDPIVSQTGTGFATVDGGVIYSVGLTIDTGSLLSVLDDGLVVLAGDQLSLVNGYIGSGLIIGQASVPDSGPYSGNTVIETPEPMSLLFLAAGGLALLRRRRS